MMDGARVVRERLSIHALLWPRRAITLAGVLGARRTHLLRRCPRCQHPGTTLQH